MLGGLGSSTGIKVPVNQPDVWVERRQSRRECMGHKNNCDRVWRGRVAGGVAVDIVEPGAGGDPNGVELRSARVPEGGALAAGAARGDVACGVAGVAM